MAEIRRKPPRTTTALLKLHGQPASVEARATQPRPFFARSRRVNINVALLAQNEPTQQPWTCRPVFYAATEADLRRTQSDSVYGVEKSSNVVHTA